MTDCPNADVRDLLPDLLHGRLTTAEREVVESHVRGCADCREELTLLRAMSATLQRGPRVDVAAVASAIPVYRAPVRRSWGGWRAAAAIVALAAGGTSVAVMQRDAGPGADSLGTPQVVAEAPNTAVMARAAAPSRELALGSAAVGDLDDGELLVLLQDLQSLEVLPSADVETSTVVPVSAAGTE
jgi:anti-sigma factor RsiW